MFEIVGAWLQNTDLKLGSMFTCVFYVDQSIVVSVSLIADSTRFGKRVKGEGGAGIREIIFYVSNSYLVVRRPMLFYVSYAEPQLQKLSQAPC